MPRTKVKQQSRKKKGTRKKYKYQCRACGRKFNYKCNGRCPHCGSNRIKSLVRGVVRPVLKSQRKR